MSTKKLQIVTPIVTSVNGKTGDVTVATKTSELENDSEFATTGYVDTKVAGIVDSAPETLDTLNELSAALGNDPNFATTVATQIGSKADKSHAHNIADVTNLQSTLDDKATQESFDSHTNNTTVHITAAERNSWNGKAESSHTHAYLPTAGGTMTGAITTKGIKLTSGTDYGATLPSNPQTNQLFFQTVGSNFVLDNVYPVGSIYMSVNASNPGTLFGGTWEQIQGKFLLGMSSSYPAGSQGGEAEHTLTSHEIPSHKHYVGQPGATYRVLPSNFATEDPNKEFYTTEVTSPGPRYLKPNNNWCGYLTASYLVDTPYELPHNNMPPYLSVYIWKRTA